MTQARSEQVDEETTRHYHCMTRCVRGAFLCGYDKHSNRDFEHRRRWIVDRLKFLESVFAIDVLAYAVMANHLHLVLELMSDVAAAWSPAEVVERYGRVFPMPVSDFNGLSDAQQAERVAKWRERLSSLSWMMRALNEWVARRANREEGCTGRFWQGRFTSEPLLDESALLTCMAYVDLNPVRSGECQRLEDARWTSIGARLHHTTKVLDAADEASPTGAPAGLVPFADQASLPGGVAARAPCEPLSRSVPMNFVDYVELLEWTGRTERERGPSGTLRGPPPAVLTRLRIRSDAWLRAMRVQGLKSRGALGRVDALDAFAEKRGRSRTAGRAFALALFG